MVRVPAKNPTVNGHSANQSTEKAARQNKEESHGVKCLSEQGARPDPHRVGNRAPSPVAGTSELSPHKVNNKNNINATIFVKSFLTVPLICFGSFTGTRNFSLRNYRKFHCNRISPRAFFGTETEDCVQFMFILC